MNEREQLIQLCLKLPEAVEDYPFDDPDITIMRHRENKKWFAMVFYLHGEVCLNIKADPMDVDILCETYKGIQPGWHMNKRHWITIHPNKDVSWMDIEQFIKQSFALTMSKAKKKKADDF